LAQAFDITLDLSQLLFLLVTIFQGCGESRKVGFEGPHSSRWFTDLILWRRLCLFGAFSWEGLETVSFGFGNFLHIENLEFHVFHLQGQWCTVQNCCWMV